ncbi:hypothetical protein KJ652_04510 [Patescibacteria group bacterium]|nr:hypothetical protein [Patescibacteria group bacterium]MBU1123829.1 hypothetical protein [Patescibacteria group bacterium]MBU1911372.1 hypothetical protein [Patescibacteria group bacterium]
MRKLLLIIPLLLSTSAVAQEPELTAGDLIPIITGPEEIKVGRTLVLDASSSKGLGEDTTYKWYVQGIPQPISRTVEVVYTPEKTDTLAIRLVIQTTVDDEVYEAETQRVVVVYERKIALIADTTIPQEKLLLHQETAANEGVYLRIIQPMGPTLPVSTEEALFNAISEKSTALAGAESIILWTDGITGLQALMRAAEADPSRVSGIENQTIVMITDRGLNTLSKTARGPFSVLKPDRILITRKEAINPLLAAENIESFLSDIEQRDIDLLIVDETSTYIRPWNLLSALVNYMLTHGISSQVVILLLTLPLIATIIAFFKQVIGITTFGLYTPSVVALSFLALGWQIGLAFLIFILITGYTTRTLLKRWRLLYIPKVAIILTVVSITLLLLLGIGAAFEFTFGRDTIFILLIMSTLAESFLTVKAEEGLLGAILGIGETVLAALICVIIVSRPWLQSVLLAYPEVILLTLIIDIGLGKWTGLRLVEYFRFREVFKHLQEE